MAGLQWVGIIIILLTVHLPNTDKWKEKVCWSSDFFPVYLPLPPSPCLSTWKSKKYSCNLQAGYSHLDTQAVTKFVLTENEEERMQLT